MATKSKAKNRLKITKKKISRKLGIKLIRMIKPKNVTSKKYNSHCEYLAKASSVNNLMNRLDSLKNTRKMH